MFRTIGSIILLLLATAGVNANAASPFTRLTTESPFSSGQFAVTRSLPQADVLQRLVLSSSQYGSSESDKLTYKNVLLGNIAPFVDGAMKNMTVSVPSTFVSESYDDDSYFLATKGDQGAYASWEEVYEIGGFKITQQNDDTVTVTSKGDFYDYGIPLTVKELQSYGLTNVKVQKGLFKGMKGYFALSAEATTEEEQLYVLYVYDPNSESTAMIQFKGGSNEKRNAEIWKNFVKSAFAKVKVTKGAVTETEPYENSLYSINLPAGWTSCECEDPYELYLMDSVTYNFSSGSFTPNIYVEGALTGETTADLKFYKEVAGDFFEEEGGALKSVKTVKTKNGQGLMIEGTFSLDGIPSVGKQLVMMKGGVTYVLTAVVPKTKWKEYDKAITASLISFKVK